MVRPLLVRHGLTLGAREGDPHAVVAMAVAVVMLMAVVLGEVAFTWWHRWLGSVEHVVARRCQVGSVSWLAFVLDGVP